MKTKLINHILNNYQGMAVFRKEYHDISDKMLVEDCEMLIHLYHSTELESLLNEFKEKING